jgi:hypothetical protein
MPLDIAPWAEPVLVTAEELLARADDAWHYELVEGRKVDGSSVLPGFACPVAEFFA